VKLVGKKPRVEMTVMWQIALDSIAVSLSTTAMLSTVLIALLAPFLLPSTNHCD